MSDVFVYEAVRTERGPDLDPDRVDEIVLGNAKGAGVDNRNVARMAGLLAGLPTSVPGTTVNRLCGSSPDAPLMGARQIALGESEVVLVGEAESMSRAPWVVPKPTRGFPTGDASLVSTTLGWRPINPEMPEAWTVSLAQATEQLREREGVTRDGQDSVAVRLHQAAAEAWDTGFYSDLVVPVRGVDFDRDESSRSDCSLEALAALKPVFRADGTVTALLENPEA